MKYCAKCGHGNDDNSEVCIICAQALGDNIQRDTQPKDFIQEPANNSDSQRNPGVLWLVLNVLLTVICCCLPPVALLGIEGSIFSGIGISAHNKGEYDRRDSMAVVGKVLFFTGLGMAIVIGLAVIAFCLFFAAGLRELGMSWQEFLDYYYNAYGYYR